MKSLRYLVPNLCTSAALTCGVIAIALAMRGDPLEATWWVMYATLLDRMDGAAARALNAQSAMGGQLDSFSDVVSFGLAPAFIFMGAASESFRAILLLPVLVYVLGCTVRLARFNISGQSPVFFGLPSTLAGGVYAVAMNVALRHELATETLVLLFAVILVAFGVAMNFPWLQYGKMGRESSRVLGAAVASLVAIAAVLVLLRQLPELILAITSTGIWLGPFLAAWDRRRAISART